MPTSLSEVKAGYLKDSNDPLLASLGFPESAWFTAAVILELAIQCPCFIYGSWALYKGEIPVYYGWLHHPWLRLTSLYAPCISRRPSDRPSAYPLLIAYASLASSSTLFCLVQALCGPTSSTLTSAHRQAIWQAYGPFLLVPTIMLVDMLSRCHHLIQSLPVVDRKVKSK